LARGPTGKKKWERRREVPSPGLSTILNGGEKKAPCQVVPEENVDAGYNPRPRRSPTGRRMEKSIIHKKREKER